MNNKLTMSLMKKHLCPGNPHLPSCKPPSFQLDW